MEALIELLRADLRSAVGEIKTALDSRVDVAVYQADQRRIEQQIEAVRAEADREIAATRSACEREVAAARAEVEEEKRAREKEKTDDKEARETEQRERRADRRMVLAAVISAALSFLVTVSMLVIQLQVS